LLPIPMLDGGHLLVFAIEGALRRPLTATTRVRIQQAGLVIIALIVILAAGNDVVRFFS
jgi:regulator of sigma E protease